MNLKTALIRYAVYTAISSLAIFVIYIPYYIWIAGMDGAQLMHAFVGTVPYALVANVFILPIVTWVIHFSDRIAPLGETEQARTGLYTHA